MGLGKFFTSAVTAWRREERVEISINAKDERKDNHHGFFCTLTLRTSILRPLSDESPSGICKACTNASVNCCTTGKINALAAPYGEKRGKALFKKYPHQENLK